MSHPQTRHGLLLVLALIGVWLVSGYASRRPTAPAFVSISTVARKPRSPTLGAQQFGIVRGAAELVRGRGACYTAARAPLRSVAASTEVIDSASEDKGGPQSIRSIFAGLKAWASNRKARRGRLSSLSPLLLLVGLGKHIVRRARQAKARAAGPEGTVCEAVGSRREGALASMCRSVAQRFKESTQRLRARRAAALASQGPLLRSLAAAGSLAPPMAMMAATAVAGNGAGLQGKFDAMMGASVQKFMHAFQGPKRDTLLLLLTTTLVVPIMTRLKTSPILGFLLVGMLLGPHGMSVVSDLKTTEALAELGIVFFLFEMGLELSVERLFQMRRDVFGLGFAQFSVTAAAIFALSRVLGQAIPASIVIGGALALSSSAFVLQLLRDKDALGSRYGRASFGVLLFQDLAVVPLLVITPLLASGGGSAMAWAIGAAAFKAGIAFSLILLTGKFVLDRVFNFVAKSRSQEAFLAVILVTVLTMSTLTEGLGLSNTLGAFLAGVLLSETKYRYQVEADIVPFRGLLLGLFFMTVGFEIDLTLISSQFPLIMSLLGGLLALKTAIIAALCLAFGLSLSNAQNVGLLLSQGGEFAFVAFGIAKALGILPAATAKLLLTTVALSMAVTPGLAELGSFVSEKIENKFYGFSHYVGADAEGKAIKNTQNNFVVVCGYGRIGKMVCDLLNKKFIPYVAFDINPSKVVEARNRGLSVFFGDVSRPEVLRSFNVDKARAVVVTTNEMRATNKAVVTLRKLYPDMPIYARAVDTAHQKRLQNTLDVYATVPILPEDSILLSLPFGGRVLRKMGVSPEEVDMLLEDTRRKALAENFGVEADEEEEILQQLGALKSSISSRRDVAAAATTDSASAATATTSSNSPGEQHAANAVPAEAPAAAELPQPPQSVKSDA